MCGELSAATNASQLFWWKSSSRLSCLQGNGTLNCSPLNFTLLYGLLSVTFASATCARLLRAEAAVPLREQRLFARRLSHARSKTNWSTDPRGSVSGYRWIPGGPGPAAAAPLRWVAPQRRAGPRPASGPRRSPAFRGETKRLNTEG